MRKGKTFTKHVKKIFRGIFLLGVFGIIWLIAFGVFLSILGCGMSAHNCNYIEILPVILFWCCPWLVVLILSLKYRKNTGILFIAFLPVLLGLISYIFSIDLLGLLAYFLRILNIELSDMGAFIAFALVPILIILIQIFLIKRLKKA